APQDRGHTELVRVGERLGDLHELPRGLVAPKVDRRADGHAPHLERLLDAGEHHLVVLVGVGEELVVVDLEDERDLVGVLPRHGPEHAVRRGDGVAPALDGELDDLRRVEVVGVLGERGAGGVLDALVDGEDREVAGAGEAAVTVELLERAEDGDGAGRVLPDRAPERGAGEVEALLRDLRVREAEEALGLVAKELFEAGDGDFSHRSRRKTVRGKGRGEYRRRLVENRRVLAHRAGGHGGFIRAARGPPAGWHRGRRRTRGGAARGGAQ